MNRLEVQIRRLPGAQDLPLPSYQTQGSAGLDLYAAVSEPLCIEPGAWAVVPTGIAIALTPGFEAQVRPRSGLAARFGVTVLNAPGTIDADYRGEIKVPLINHSKERFVVERAHRIAQLVIAPVLLVVWQEVETLDLSTQRAASGFGSTGR